MRAGARSRIRIDRSAASAAAPEDPGLPGLRAHRSEGVDAAVPAADFEIQREAAGRKTCAAVHQPRHPPRNPEPESRTTRAPESRVTESFFLANRGYPGRNLVVVNVTGWRARDPRLPDRVLLDSRAPRDGAPAEESIDTGCETRARPATEALTARGEAGSEG